MGMNVQTYHLNQFGIRVKQSRLNKDGGASKKTAAGAFEALLVALRVV
jgi:hypothetical protein